MKFIFLAIAVLSGVNAFAYRSPYDCIDKKSAQAILVANLASDLGYNRAPVSTIEDIDATIEYYFKNLIETEQGYISLPNNYYTQTISISCLGVYQLK